MQLLPEMVDNRLHMTNAALKGLSCRARSRRDLVGYFILRVRGCEG